MKKVIREPLLHFILIGSVFFLLSALFSETERNEVIVIEDSDIEELISKFEMQWNRKPTGEELTHILQQDLRTEVYYREALGMGLDHNDEIIKRRLSQKMEFIAGDLATMREPDEDELIEFFHETQENYKTPYIYSFYQLYFSPDIRKDPINDATIFLTENAGSTPEEVKATADRSSLPFWNNEVSADLLSRDYGSGFSDEMEKVVVDKWVGPVMSGYGAHIVYVSKKKEPQIPPFEDVRNKVIDEYNYRRTKELDESMFRSLLKKYEIDVKLKDPESAEMLSTYINSVLSE